MPVSIVIPAYNAAATIAATLDSILAQTFADWEAIVVDDGSKDATGTTARAFADRDPRFRVIAQCNAGEAGARNTGIAQVLHNWLLFVDADDWIAPNHLQRMTAELAANPGLDAVYCQYARVAADGTQVVDNYLAPAGDLFPILARRAAFPVHACVVRKSCVDAVGRFDTSLRTCSDWDLWQRVARTGARFGAVAEVLAYYRMTPSSVSLDSRQLFTDDLRVLKQGHGPDPRVKNPKPEHANGAPPDQAVTQEFYLLSWCAGLLLGTGEDARPLLEMVGEDHFAELYPDAIAQCIFDAAPLPTCQSPRAWEKLWPDVKPRVEDFFAALEKQSMAPDLARRAMTSLKQRILKASPTWSLVADALGEIRAPLEEARDSWQRLAEERARALVEQRRLIDDLQRSQALLQKDRDSWQRLAEERERAPAEQRRLIDNLQRSQALLQEDRDNWRRLAQEREKVIASANESKALLEVDRSNWRRLAEERELTIGRQSAQIAEIENARTALAQSAADLAAERAALQEQLRQRSAERDELKYSYEQRVGDFLFNKLRLRAPLLLLDELAATVGQRLAVLRLAIDSRLFGGRGKRGRVLTTVCDTFPIYSQTFVYQELTQLSRQGYDLRLVYSKLDGRDRLSAQFAALWRIKRRLRLNNKIHEKDFARYQARMPEKVATLVYKLCQHSGMTRQELLRHGNFLQAFSFTRMVEAYRPQYLHSYFFYDRSLMALVAGYLLDIPRGITCYTDHLLKDYELKLVPLHLQLCDIVIATSERIKKELLVMAPQTDPGRIVVKPNGIDAQCFQQVERTEPPDGAPFRLVSVCRIEPKKGLLDLVAAVALLRQQGLNVEAHIVGTVDEWSQASRDYKNVLDQKISQLNLWGKVHLEGRQALAGIQRFLSIGQIFVAPFVETESGDKDGIPTALLEGMATGLPVVATDAGSIAEVVDHGREGLIVGQHDGAALAGAIAQLIGDPVRRRSFGDRAAQRVRDEYDVASCEAMFHQRLSQVLYSRLGQEADGAKR